MAHPSEEGMVLRSQAASVKEKKGERGKRRSISVVQLKGKKGGHVAPEIRARGEMGGG